MTLSTTEGGGSFLEFARSRWHGVPPEPREPRRPLSQEIFKEIVIKERKRADRLNQPHALLLVSVNDPEAAGSAFVCRPIIEALGMVTRETDVIGWFAWPNVLGVVLTEIRSFEAASARAMEDRASRELAGRLDPDTAGKLTIRLHVIPSQTRAAGQERWPDASRSPYDAVKRGVDVLGSLTLLILLSPLFLLIGLLVKAGSRGPVFFAQTRVGQMMKPFRMQKFRTMKVDADSALHREYVTSFINATAQSQQSAGQPLFKIVQDPRVTRFGRVLRKTSLDELPQLWNVLRGEMSLVGPRPALPYELEQYKPWHCRRVLEAKPGITGLWQVVGRSRTTFDEMVRLDLRYAKTCSLWNDLKILAATPAAVFSGKGAC